MRLRDVYRRAMKALRSSDQIAPLRLLQHSALAVYLVSRCFSDGESTTRKPLTVQHRGIRRYLVFHRTSVPYGTGISSRPRASATLEPLGPSRYRVLTRRFLLTTELSFAWFVWCVGFGLARCHRRRWADCRMAHQYAAGSGEPMWGVVMRRAFLLLWLIRAGVAQLVEQRFCKP